MIEFISQSWPWYVAGPLISLIMFAMLYFGKRFGVSSNLRTLCAIGGAGKYADFFRFDWKAQIWNLIFILGVVTGGYIATNFLNSGEPIQLADSVVKELTTYGISNPEKQLMPSELFSWEALFTLRGFIMLVVGGFLVGFGTRYAGGCTSGHAISGLSELQVPSLIATIGFFIGGYLMNHFLLSYILSL